MHKKDAEVFLLMEPGYGANDYVIGHMAGTCNYCVAICLFLHRTICLWFNLAAVSKSDSTWSALISAA